MVSDLGNHSAPYKEIAKEMPGYQVMDGCIYIVSYVSAPGEITQSSTIFRVMFGTIDHHFEPKLHIVSADMDECGISAIVADNIQLENLRKFSSVSPMAAIGSFYDVPVGVWRTTPEMRADFVAAMKEIMEISKAMDLALGEYDIDLNLHMIDDVTPDTTVSMQKDLKKGGSSEIDALIFEVVRAGRRYGIPTPVYEKVAKKFGLEMEE